MTASGAEARVGGDPAQDGATVWIEQREGGGYGGRESGSTVTCTTDQLDRPLLKLPAHPDLVGYWAIRTCSDGATEPPTNVSQTFVWITVADPAELAQSALARLVVPLPDPQTSPRRGVDAIVGLPTWFWVDPAAWQPMEASVSQGGVTVTARAEPVELLVDTGDGPPLRCAGGGRPYDFAQPPEANGRSDCAVVFDRAGARTTTVSTVWRVSWSATSGHGGPLDDVVRTTTIDVPVRSLQAVGVG